MSAIALPVFPPLNTPLTRRDVIVLAILLGVLAPIALVRRLRPPIKVTRHEGDFSNEFSPQDFDVSSVTYSVEWPENAPQLVVYPDGPKIHGQIVWPRP